MELKNFVEESLVQICEGIKGAQARTEGSGAYISPRMSDSGNASSSDKIFIHKVHNVDFDVAIEVSTQNSQSNKNESKFSIAIATIFSGNIQGGTHNEQKGQDSNISRLKFSIPVCWPCIPVREKSCESNADALVDLLYDQEKSKL